MLLGRCLWQAKKQPHRLADSSHSRSCEDSFLLYKSSKKKKGFRTHGIHGGYASKRQSPLCHPEDFVLLSSFLQLVFTVTTTSLTIYDLCENSVGVSSPSLGSIPALLLVLDLFQALLLEKMSDSLTTLSNDHHP